MVLPLKVSYFCEALGRAGRSVTQAVLAHVKQNVRRPLVDCTSAVLSHSLVIKMVPLLGVFVETVPARESTNHYENTSSSSSGKPCAKDFNLFKIK